MNTCIACGDEIYEGESRPAEPGVHTWCVLMTAGLFACKEAMKARRAKGLPTPSHPWWTNPPARGN